MKNRKGTTTYLAFEQGGARAGAHLAHGAPPNHGLLQSPLRLNPTQGRKDPRECHHHAQHREGQDALATHQVDEVIALGVREEPAVQERPARTNEKRIAGQSIPCGRHTTKKE